MGCRDIRRSNQQNGYILLDLQDAKNWHDLPVRPAMSTNQDGHDVPVCFALRAIPGHDMPVDLIGIRLKQCHDVALLDTLFWS